MAKTVALVAATALSQKIAARAKTRSGGIKTLAEGRSDIHKVNPFLIEVEAGFNVRDFESPELAEHVDNLAQSISVKGVIRPLKVRNKGGKLVLVDGECRLRGVIRAIEVYDAEIVTIPVILADRSESDADAVLGILIENSGLDLTVAGKAEVVKRLLGFGWSKDEIAQKAGMSKARVHQLLDFAGLSTEVKALVSDGTVSASTALQVARDHAFDDVATAEKIKAASATKMAASGSARVTAKALTGPSLKTALADIFGDAIIDNVGTGDDATVILSISAADYEVVKTLLKLS